MGGVNSVKRDSGVGVRSSASFAFVVVIRKTELVRGWMEVKVERPRITLGGQVGGSQS
jgi:hypothetical protein